MPLSSFFGGVQRFAGQKLNQEQQDALRAAGSLGAFAAVVPASTILPYGNSIEDTTKIKQKEAQRMFPGADPNLFDRFRGRSIEEAIQNTNAYSKNLNTIPLTQSKAYDRVFDNISRRRDLYKPETFFETYLNQQPGAPNPELGSYQQAISNKTIFSEGDIQALTVTPRPDPSRFAQDYAEILADKLGKTLNEFESGKEWNSEAAQQARKIHVLSSKIPGTAGYVWGNTKYPQYSYAEGNWGLGQKVAEANPSIYVSRINADPSKEAEYLYTHQVLPEGRIKEKDYLTIDPRAKFKQYEELGLGTGPSWGVASNKDISFRKDLIGARGELTTGDLQALLAERNLPFDYQVVKGRSYGTKRPGGVLQTNLEALAKAENITPYQAIERFARVVPNIGEPATPPTPAVFGRESSFPFDGPAISPFGKFASKTDLRQIGILPSTDKARYKAFSINESEPIDKYTYRSPRYSASTILEPDIDTTKGFGDFIIYRDLLRPQAANKLLDRTVKNLVEQSKPIKGLGLGGLATGAVATAMDPAVIDALSRGDYMQAGTTAAINTTVGSATGAAVSKGLQALGAAGYVRPAAAIGSALPAAGGVLAGAGAVETGKAFNRAYRAQTGKDWVTRNKPASPYSTYAGPTPTVKPRMGTAILGGKTVQVPYGSVAGERKVGRPWWDKVGSTLQGAADALNSGSVIGR